MKYTVTMTRKVDIEVEDDGDEHDAIEIAKCFLDHEDDDAEEKRDDLPMGIYAGSRGSVLTYDFEFAVKKSDIGAPGEEKETASV